jgi:hypothetical protein
MKAVVLGCWLLLTGISSAQAEGVVRVSFGVFHSSLRHHGEWIRHECGDMVWRPYGIAVNWRPYTVGHWVWTSEGWFWVSDEPWGWATYHYGRWYLDPVYGWIWIPDYEWAPAWVEWRYGGDYVGWAPLGPGPILYINLWSHRHHHWVTPEPYWTFVHCRYIVHHNIKDHVYPVSENRRYIGKTRTSGSTRTEGGRTKSGGPDPRVLAERAKIRIPQVDVERVSRPQVSRADGSADDARDARPGSSGRAGDVKKRTESANRPERNPSFNQKRVEPNGGSRPDRVEATNPRTARVVAPKSRTERVEPAAPRTTRVDAAASRSPRTAVSKPQTTRVEKANTGREGSERGPAVRSGQVMRKAETGSAASRGSSQSNRVESGRKR